MCVCVCACRFGNGCPCAAMLQPGPCHFQSYRVMKAYVRTTPTNVRTFNFVVTTDFWPRNSFSCQLRGKRDGKCEIENLMNYLIKHTISFSRFSPYYVLVSSDGFAELLVAHKILGEKKIRPAPMSWRPSPMGNGWTMRVCAICSTENSHFDCFSLSLQFIFG